VRRASVFNRRTLQAVRLIITLTCLSALWASCAGGQKTLVPGGPVEGGRLADGVYEGSFNIFPNKALVEVTVRDNRIAGIRILRHWAWKGRKAEAAIVRRIIREQSTRVDAVSGATNSSRVIMGAVQDAIENAYAK
jgi:major membrane immunogen (membrane-anchored lipoprotein)